MSVSAQDKLFLTKHMATMVKAGVPISQVLETVREQASPEMMRLLIKIEKDVENGSSLADAFGKHKNVFDPFYLSLIRAGEASGTLETNLGFLAEQMAKDYSLRRKVGGALMYPGLVIGATTVMGLGISWYVLPQLVDMFNSFEVDLPFITKVLMGFAWLMKNYGTLIIAGVIGSFLGLMALLRLRPIRFVWDSLVLKIPMIGNIAKYSEVGRFARNLGTLLKSGLPVVTAFGITIDTLSNLKFKHDLMEAKDKIADGKSIFDSLNKKEYPEFPKLLTRMIDVGEKSGNLEEMLLYVADYYDEEIDQVSKNMATLLEPVLLIIIGLVVGFVALAIITPIYSLMGQIR